MGRGSLEEPLVLKVGTSVQVVGEGGACDKTVNNPNEVLGPKCLFFYSAQIWQSPIFEN